MVLFVDACATYAMSNVGLELVEEPLARRQVDHLPHLHLRQNLAISQSPFGLRSIHPAAFEQLPDAHPII